MKKTLFEDRATVPALTQDDHDSLTSGRNIAIRHGAATLIVARRIVKTIRGTADESYFVLEGPSGKHTLLVRATDLERLNAHWRTFASDPKNQIV